MRRRYGYYESRFPWDKILLLTVIYLFFAGYVLGVVEIKGIPAVELKDDCLTVCEKFPPHSILSFRTEHKQLDDLCICEYFNSDTRITYERVYLMSGWEFDLKAAEK